jgi:hypothetical protein
MDYIQPDDEAENGSRIKRRDDEQSESAHIREVFGVEVDGLTLLVFALGATKPGQCLHE